MPSPRLEIAERLDGLCDRAWVNGAFYDDLRGAAELLREAEAALQQARQERDEARDRATNTRNGQLARLALERADTAEAALQQARESLDRYAWHDDGCEALSESGLVTVDGQPCTCGLDAALSQRENPQ
jgi:multidrug efflux pump subunit AcrA (membrane-fusion protein)